MWKDWFYFTKGERRGIYILLVAIAMAAGACYLPDYLARKNELPSPQEDWQACQEFLASMREREERQKEEYSYPAEKSIIALAPFDPNTADSVTFIRLGLKPWQARNILKYRSKKGKFRKPEDFSKIYGLTAEQYRMLLPYIILPEKKQVPPETIRYALAEKHEYPKVFKYPEGTQVDLNRADTTELKKIPGIGSSIARMIVGYRNRLGGFYRVSQLQDEGKIPSELNKWFHIDQPEIRKINLNRASAQRMKSHPYISPLQSIAILEYRKKKGKLKNLKQLALYEEFSAEDLERISHYAEF